MPQLTCVSLPALGTIFVATKGIKSIFRSATNQPVNYTITSLGVLSSQRNSTPYYFSLLASVVKPELLTGTRS